MFTSIPIQLSILKVPVLPHYPTPSWRSRMFQVRQFYSKFRRPLLFTTGLNRHMVGWRRGRRAKFKVSFIKEQVLVLIALITPTISTSLNAIRVQKVWQVLDQCRSHLALQRLNSRFQCPIQFLSWRVRPKVSVEVCHPGQQWKWLVSGYWWKWRQHCVGRKYFISRGAFFANHFYYRCCWFNGVS